MAREQDVIQLPFRVLGITDQEMLLVALDRNFKEIERMLGILQLYMKKTGKPVDQIVSENHEIWNRASSINPDGTIPTEKLSDKLVGLQHELQLADQAVTEAKIAVGAIREYHIEAGEIPVVKTNFPYHQLY